MLTSTPVASKESGSGVCKRTGGESGKNVQAALFLKSTDAEQRQAILDEGNISPVEVNAKTMVAMKADMGIPWEKMKTISRYGNEFQFKTLENNYCSYTSIHIYKHTYS